VRVLVTGGAGYIGRHTCKALASAGMTPVTLDSLAIGDREAVKWGPFVHGDVLNLRTLEEAAKGCRYVVHLAAWSDVGEGEQNPRKYRENVEATLRVAQLGLGVVFASSASIYGDGAGPVSHYGRSKAAGELMLSEAVTLRYFNVAGGSGDKGAHIVPRAVAALKDGRTLTLNGDGQCVRDYVHVEDVAEANLLAVRALACGERAFSVDVCTGKGSTVRQVVEACEAVSGRAAATALGPPRSGDPQRIVGAPCGAEKRLGWRPTAGLMSIAQSAWEAA
jgi:UDP-glucose 4-epimerase